MLTASDEAIYVINNSSETVLYSTNNVLSNKIPSEINNIAHQLSASGNYQKYTDNKQSKFIFYKTIEVLNTPNLYCIFVSFHLDNLAFFQKSYYAYYSADKTDEGY